MRYDHLRRLAKAAAEASCDSNWITDSGGSGGWVYTQRAPIRFNRGDGLPTKHMYNGRNVLVSKGSGALRRDLPVQAYIAAVCPATVLGLLDRIAELEARA